MNFKINQTVPTALQDSYVLGEGINDFKKNFIQYILPVSYAGSSLSVISLANVIYDKVKQTISIEGFVDKLAGVNITDLSKTIADNIKTTGIIAPFGTVTSQNVKVHPFDNTIDPDATANTTIATADPGAPASVAAGPNLAAILIPSIIGGLLLLSLLSCLLCYCCKWCCFKKKGALSGTEVYTANQDRMVKATTTENVGSTPFYTTVDGGYSDRRMVPTKL